MNPATDNHPTGGSIEPEFEAQFTTELLRRAKVDRVPLDGSIELTHRCNLRCVHCFLGDQGEIRKHRHDEMSTDAVKSVLDELAAAETLNLTISGGDPMMRKDFVELYSYAVRAGLLVSVFCDAVLITERIAEVFRALPPRMVEISLYGATEATYEGITQIKGSFRRCLAGIDRLHQRGLRFKLKTVLMTKNRHELDAMRAMAERLGVKFYFDTAVFPCLPGRDNAARANPIGKPKPGSVDVAPPGIGQPLTFRLSPKAAAESQIEDPQSAKEMAALYLRTREYHDDHLYVCGAGLNTFHIDPYGQLQPCTISRNIDHNVLEKGFLAGWNGPVADIRKLKSRSDLPCTSCDKRGICSGCPAMFAAETGAPDVRSSYLCQTTHALHAALEPHINRLLESAK